MKEINIEDLNKTLYSEDIDFKVSQVAKTGKGNIYAHILAYKDARVDMDILDDVVGAENWQNRYERDSKGVLQCGIGIYLNKQWVWKWSNGVPSAFESEKGEYSDAFKRAGFMWGIGRCLYEFPRITILLNESEYYEKDGKIKASRSFNPNYFKWTITEGYQKITAHQWMGQSKVLRFDSNPYNSKNPRS